MPFVLEDGEQITAAKIELDKKRVRVHRHWRKKLSGDIYRVEFLILKEGSITAASEEGQIVAPNDILI